MKKNWNYWSMKGTHGTRITAKSSIYGISYEIGWGRVGRRYQRDFGLAPAACWNWGEWGLKHRKKIFRGFPFPSRDVTYQTLSRREYVSLIKSEVFPFPSWNSHRILLNQLVFLFADRSFPGYSSSAGGNSSKIFDNSFVYLFPAWNFPVFSPFGQSSLIYINCVWVNYIHI